MKNDAAKRILIVSLYAHDLLFTGNNSDMFSEFKKSMKAEFDMTDLGKTTYFLGVEVVQSEDGIFIGQSKYAKEVLHKFGMAEVNAVKTPIVLGCSLTKTGNGDLVDATNYKQYCGELIVYHCH